MSFFRNDVFAFKHIIQKCGACFVPKYKNILIPAFANNRKFVCRKVDVVHIDTNEFTDADAGPEEERQDCKIPLLRAHMVLFLLFG